MNKEQLKKSLLEIMNYYVKSIVALNLDAKGASEEIISMAENQASVLSKSFNFNLNKMIDEYASQFEIGGEADE
jgi:hypothetical protein